MPIMPMPISTSDSLVSLVTMLNSSLAMYISDSGIWSYPGPEEIKLAMADLVGDQQNIIERAAIVLMDRDIPASGHAYPLQFASLHDLELRSLLPRIVAGLRRQNSHIDAILAAGNSDPIVCELANEARRMALGHIDILEQIVAKLAQAVRAGVAHEPSDGNQTD